MCSFVLDLWGHMVYLVSYMKCGELDKLFAATSAVRGALYEGWEIRWVVFIDLIEPVVKSQVLAALVLGDTCIASLKRIVLNTNGLLLLVKVTPVVHGSPDFFGNSWTCCTLVVTFDWPSIVLLCGVGGDSSKTYFFLKKIEKYRKTDSGSRWTKLIFAVGCLLYIFHFF